MSSKQMRAVGLMLVIAATASAQTTGRTREATPPARGRTREATPPRPQRTQEVAPAATAPSTKPTMADLIKDRDPRQGFLKTLNGFRSKRNLPPMQLHNSLNQACQWLTDVMAKHDRMGHDPVKIGMEGRPRVNDPAYRAMSSPSMRMKHFKYPGQPGVEAAGESRMELDGIGGDAALDWAMSSTHYRPFLSMDGQVYKEVGFGFSKVGNTNRYYTCAVFGNP